MIHGAKSSTDRASTPNPLADVRANASNRSEFASGSITPAYFRRAQSQPATSRRQSAKAPLPAEFFAARRPRELRSSDNICCCLSGGEFYLLLAFANIRSGF